MRLESDLAGVGTLLNARTGVVVLQDVAYRIRVYREDVSAGSQDNPRATVQGLRSGKIQLDVVPGGIPAFSRDQLVLRRENGERWICMVMDLSGTGECRPES